MAKRKSEKANEASAREPVKPGKRKKYDVTPEQFIKVWQASDSADEAAKKLGKLCTLAGAAAR